MRKVLLMDGGMVYAWALVGEAPFYRYAPKLPLELIADTSTITLILIEKETEIRGKSGFVELEIWRHVSGPLEKAPKRSVQKISTSEAMKLLNMLTDAGYFKENDDA